MASHPDIVVEKKSDSPDEDKCVHDVSLTRARKAVIMAVNSIRHNSKGETKKGIESEFVDNLKRPDLITYRK